MQLLPCKGPFNFLVCTFFARIILAQPCLCFVGSWTRKDSAVHLGVSKEKKPTSYTYEAFTCYNLVSVASNITHCLLFMYRPLPCKRLPLHVTAKTRRTKILVKFIKLCVDGPNYPQRRSRPSSVPACRLYAQQWTSVIPERSLSWELLEFGNQQL